MPLQRTFLLRLRLTLLISMFIINASVLCQPTIATDQLLLTTRAPAHYPYAECHALDGNPGMTAKYNKQSHKLAGQSAAYLLK